MMTYSPDPQPTSPGKNRQIRHLATSTILLLGTLVCVLLTAIGVSALGGFVAGQKQRDISATQTTAMDIDLQFSLGVSDLEAGEFSRAAARFHWVLERVPDYPGAAERLAEAEQALAGGSSGEPGEPTLAPSTSENPEVLFSEGLAYFDRQEWANAISRLQQVQGLDPHYREVEVKEMLYTAYSTLGLSYIRGERIEEGLFLLEQAEVIRPLEDLTAGERYLATLYSTGQTYWGLNWPVVLQNFEAIIELAPNYRDVSERLWEAHVKYADQLTAGGAPCDGVAEYDLALAMRDDDVVREKRDQAEDACANPTPLPTATAFDPFSTPASAEEPGGNGGEPTTTPGYNIP